MDGEEQVTITAERLNELVFQAAGAATRPFMEDHPDYEMPSERVVEAVEGVMRRFGMPIRERT